MQAPGIGPGRSRHERGRQSGVVAPGGVQEEAADRRQGARQRIQRLQRARLFPQRPEDGGHPVLAVGRGAQAGVGRQRRVGRRREGGADVGQGLGPGVQPRSDGGQRRLGFAQCGQEFAVVRGIEVTGQEAQAVQRLEQGRQDRHHVVEIPLVHRATIIRAAALATADCLRAPGSRE